jgi:Outer membrane lipoprotein-sorting protein
MRIYPIIALTGLLCLNGYADPVSTNLDARVILDKVLANRPVKDFSLKARLFVGSEDPVMVEILVKNTPTETRTIYRGGQTQVLVVQPVNGKPGFYLKGVGEMTGARRAEKLLGSEFSYYDLAMPFLRWPNPKMIDPDDRVRGRDCFAIEIAAEGEPYARVKVWIDKEYFALLRAEAFDKDGNLVRRFAVTSFKKIGEAWVPRGLEAAILPPGQSLPNQQKSRLEVYEGDYGTQLPAEWFASEGFGATASGGGNATH